MEQKQLSVQWIQDAVLSIERMKNHIDEIWKEREDIMHKITELNKEYTRLGRLHMEKTERMNMMKETVDNVKNMQDMFLSYPPR